jgi:hypothetical protein
MSTLFKPRARFFRMNHYFPVDLAQPIQAVLDYRIDPSMSAILAVLPPPLGCRNIQLDGFQVIADVALVASASAVKESRLVASYGVEPFHRPRLVECPIRVRSDQGEKGLLDTVATIGCG